MPCFHPLKAYRSREILESGKRALTFNGKQAQSIDFHALELPCGKCIGCRVDRSRAWAVRCMHEAQMHQDNCFITLTYDDEHLPEDYSVSLDAYQKFLKRLRESVPQTIRFFGCAEYGDENLRPHYHFLIFGYRPTDLTLHSRKKNIPLYTSSSLQQLWKNGFSTVGNLTYQSAAYCARYVFKKIGGDLAPLHYERVHPLTGSICQVKPEFATMSRRQGIGSTWLAQYEADTYGGFVVVDGKRHPIPPFYIKRLEEARQLEQKRRSASHARKHKADSTPDRLRSRETVLVSRVSQLKRSLK